VSSVREIMRTDVVTVRSGTPVGDLTILLDKERISGAPVTDADGTVLGVVSRTDLLRLVAGGTELEAGDAFWSMLGKELPSDEGEVPDPYFTGPGSQAFVHSGSLPPFGTGLEETPVDDVMTPVAFSVSADMPVPDLAHFLVSGGIHRALVMEAGQLIGIVSGFDVLRWVAEGRDR